MEKSNSIGRNNDNHVASKAFKWSLLRNYQNSIPFQVQREYDELIDHHLNKKKVVEQVFFTQKASDYVATLNGKTVLLSDSNKKISFSEVKGINSSLVKNLEKLNFLSLTAIQQTTLPLAIEGKDVIGCSDTGSGKTLAFLIPLINQMMKNPEKLLPPEKFPAYTTCPYILIMAPTRELAEQINAEAKKVIAGLGIHSVAIYGGVKIYEQARKLTYGCEILVATPGRLIDMLKQKKVSVGFVKYVVLDEADEMLNMGFLPQIREVFSNFDLCPKTQRQNLMFSATFEDEIKDLAREFMNEFYFVSNGNGSGNKHNFDLGGNAVSSTHLSLLKNTASKWKVKENIDQVIIPARDHEYKVQYIVDIINKQMSTGAIVFVDKKQKVDEVKSLFMHNRIPTTSIHGDKPQEVRQMAINEFKKGKYKIIVATNILARGLDFVEVDYVFNFDLPMNIEDYIHRIGRTGRLGGKGYAVTFIEREDKCKKIMRELIIYLRKCDVDVPLWLGSLFPDLAALTKKEDGGDRNGDKNRNVNDLSLKEVDSNNWGNNGNSKYSNSNYNTNGNGSRNQYGRDRNERGSRYERDEYRKRSSSRSNQKGRRDDRETRRNDNRRSRSRSNSQRRSYGKSSDGYRRNNNHSDNMNNANNQREYIPSSSNNPIYSTGNGNREQGNNHYSNPSNGYHHNGNGGNRFSSSSYGPPYSNSVSTNSYNQAPQQSSYSNQNPIPNQESNAMNSFPYNRDNNYLGKKREEGNN